MNPGDAAPLGIALLGLLLGMRHATDPDHVIAVTAILSRERRLGGATRIGLVWGLGHTTTVLAVGIAIIGLKIAIPVRIGLAMEFAVAVTLILLGLGTVGALVRPGAGALFGTHPPRDVDTPDSLPDSLVVHSHSHIHDGAAHRHPHVHSADDEFHSAHVLAPGALTTSAAPRGLLKSFGVGLVHGLAGSAAIALLVLSAIPEPLWATLYLLIFCVGTIVGMGLITVAIATPFMIASQRLS